MNMHYLHSVELALELIILLFEIIYDGLVLGNVLLHCASILAYMGLDLLGSISILQGVDCVVVLYA